jgi:hypothetical protein
VDADVAALVDVETRRELKNVRSGLQWILGVLAGEGASASDFVLTPVAVAPSGRGAKRPSKPAAKAKGSKGAGKAAHGKAAKGAQKKRSKR